MDELVEKVARAICAERNAGNCVLGCTKDTGCLATSFEHDDEMRYAQAALAAIDEAHAIVPKEPTEAMVEAGERDGGHSYYRWQAMIEAALREGE